MAQTFNNLQLKVSTYNPNEMLDNNHLVRNYGLKPEVFGGVIKQLFASRTQSYTTNLYDFVENLFGMSKTQYIDNLYWTWKLRGSNYRPMTLIENRSAANPKPGANGSTIKILVDYDFATIGDTLSAGSSDKSQVMRVIAKVKDGRGYEYTCQTASDSHSHFINPKFLEVGSIWNKVMSLRGEASESGGYTYSGTDIQFQNWLSKFRNEFKVTDYGAQAKVLNVAFMDRNGVPHKTWMEMEVADGIADLKRQMAYYIFYSRISDLGLTDPDSGYPIKSGAGIQQQISFGGNVERYNTLTIEQIENFVNKIAYSRIAPSDMGEIIGMTGRLGLSNFSKAISKWSTANNVIQMGNTFYPGDPKGYHENSLTAGYQYTKYLLPNGGAIRLVYNPLYDDMSINSERDPQGNPLESQRITFVDVTGKNGGSVMGSGGNNIHLVKKNKVEKLAIVEGLVGPGGTASSKPSHKGEYFTVHMIDSVGVHIEDPSMTGELIKSNN